MVAAVIPKPAGERRPREEVSDAAPAPLAQVVRSIAVAAAITLLLGSKALLAWTNDLPIGSISDFLLYLAQAWQDLMNDAGLALFADWLRAALRALQALRW